MSDKKIKGRFSDEDKKIIISAMRDNVLYNCVSGFIEAVTIKEVAGIIKKMGAERSDEMLLKEMRDSKSKVEVWNTISGYLKLWRSEALKQMKEENKKEEGK